MAYGLWSKLLDWMDWLGDTPSTVMTTRAPAMLKIGDNEDDKFKYRCYQEEEKNKKWGSCSWPTSSVHPLLVWYILKWCVLLKFGFLWEGYLVVECKSWSTAPTNYVLTLRHSSHTHLNLYTSNHKARLAESKKRKKVVRRDLFASLSLRWLSCNVWLDLECQNMNKGIFSPPLLCKVWVFKKEKNIT